MTYFPRALFLRKDWVGMRGWEDQEEDAHIYIYILVPTSDDPAGFPSGSDSKESEV